MAGRKRLKKIYDPLEISTSFRTFAARIISFIKPRAMFAIVTIAGQQFKVEEGQEIFVHRLEAEEGDNVKFDSVNMLVNGDDTSIGTPLLSASVSATVLGHQKGDKVIVFKKKRRKGYRVKNGHRQSFTKIKIDSIAG